MADERHQLVPAGESGHQFHCVRVAAHEIRGKAAGNDDPVHAVRRYLAVGHVGGCRKADLALVGFPGFGAGDHDVCSRFGHADFRVPEFQVVIHAGYGHDERFSL